VNNSPEISQAEVDRYYEKLKKDAEDNGYFLNADIGFTKDLVRSLIINQNRYGYQSCPCRLSTGVKEQDLDIICPCDYRDPDLDEYDACYCALYVSEDVIHKKVKLKSIPERRNMKTEKSPEKSKAEMKLKYPVFRCKVCGYLCARDNPPGICPICKAKKDRFEKFISN
jgi:ferredoxin-thioredoxin reductase catalytic subunit